MSISGTLDIPFEPDRELTIRLCHNSTCETVDGVRDSVDDVSSDEPGVNPDFPMLSAAATFTNTPERRQVRIYFQGGHDSDDDYSVDVWLENGEHIVHAIFEDVDRDHCDGVSREF